MINLKIKDRITLAGETLQASAAPEGVAIDPLKGSYGSRNYPAIKALTSAGLIVPKAVGPRGGKRYFITAAGTTALAAANI